MTSGRRELTWQACDALAAAGRKPSIASVREWTLANHGRKQGSDTDTQADINAWYTVLLATKQQQSIAALPEEVAALARSLWRKANEAAADSLADQRQTIEAELEKTHAGTQAAIAAADAANKHAAAIGHQLDVAQASIRHLEEALAQARATIDATALRHTTELQHRDAQNAALRQDTIRMEADYAARVAELEGLRRHAILQIDDARTETKYWRGESERNAQSYQAQLEASRREGIEARSALAGVAGRLSAVEESLAAAQERNAGIEAALEAALARVIHATSASRNKTASPSEGSGRRHRGHADFKRRKL